ncbi:MAG TPA: LysR family transcriptional regulator [Rariglobus sp.]
MQFRDLFAKEGLSLDRLRTLVLVNDAGSISAAAPDDRNRQSLYSRQINELERFFPVALKRIHGRTAQLTPAGRELALISRQYLNDLDSFRRTYTGRPAEVAFSAGDSLIQWLILPNLPNLRASTPDFVWHLHSEQNTDIGRSLLEQSLDFGLLRADLVRNKLQSHALGSFGYRLFIPRALRTATDKLPLARALAELPIATQGDDTLFQRSLEEILAAKRWSLNACLYCDSFAHVVQAVASGAYAGILPDYMSRTEALADARTLPLNGEFDGLRRAISLAWNPQRLTKQPLLEKARAALVKHLSLPHS